MAPTVVLFLAVSGLAIAWLLGVVRMFARSEGDGREPQLQEVRAQMPSKGGR